jgi:hypothetical protein
MGDFNLDAKRRGDKTYARRKLTNEFMDAAEAAGLEYLQTPTTFHSYSGRGNDGQVQRHSTLDHCYVIGVEATVQVLPNATTDHQPLLLVINPGRVSGDTSNRTLSRVGTLSRSGWLTWSWRLKKPGTGVIHIKCVM